MANRPVKARVANKNSESVESSVTVDFNRNIVEPAGEISVDMMDQDSSPKIRERDSPHDENNNTFLETSEHSIGNANGPSVSVCDMIWLSFSILVQICVHGISLWLVIEYFSNKQILYGCSKVASVLMPAAICKWLSSRMEDDDLQVPADGKTETRNGAKEYLWAGILFTADILFQLDQLFRRRCRSWHYAYNVRKYEKRSETANQWEYYSKFVKEKSDVALLSIIQNLLGSAPLLTLKLSIWLMEKKPITTAMWFDIVSCCLTLISVSWSMTNYHRAIRLAQPDQLAIGIPGTVLIFFGCFGTITSSIFLIAVAASNWPLYTSVACAIRCIIWTISLYRKKGVLAFCRDKNVLSWIARTCVERVRAQFFAAVFSIVYSFTFVNLEEGQTHRRIIWYHVQCGLVHSLVIVLWFIFAYPTVEYVWIPGTLLIISAILFIFGIASTGSYNYFHPTMPRKCCMSSAG